MTHVREIEGGAIRVAFGSALGAALKGHDQTLVSYVRFDSGGGTDWLISFGNEAMNNAEAYSSLGKESSDLRFYPGPQGLAPPGGKWGLAVATWKQSTDTYHFYFYNLETHELETLGTGTFGGGLTWGEPDPKRIQFGLWNSSEEFNGKYASAAIFDRTLSSAEIEALAAASSVEAWASSEPTALWIFDQEESSEKVSDLMGHGADEGSITQGSTSYVNVESGLPLPLREGEEPGEEESSEPKPGAEAPTYVGVKTETGLEAATRYVKTESGLVEL